MKEIIIIGNYSLKKNFEIYKEFFTPAFHWSLTDNKSPQIFRIPLNILTDRNNTFVRMVFFLWFLTVPNLIPLLLLLLSSFLLIRVFHISVN